jgi:enterochelin esterase-like enzyme
VDHRRLETTVVDSRAMHAPMHYSVWTPRDFSPEERLPLIVFLHGGGDDHLSFDRHGVGARLDRALADGEIPRVVVVLPEGNLGFWTNWRDGTRYYEDWVIYEVMPQVRRRYHTALCPEDCHVMGVSMGGAGTMRFIFHHPDLFSSAGVISAPIMNTEAMYDFVDNRLYKMLFPTGRIWGRPPRALVEREDPFIQWQEPEDVGMRLYLAWADGDRGQIRFGGQRLADHLDEHDIPWEGGEFSGGHDWVSWTPVIVEAIAHAAGE